MHTLAASQHSPVLQESLSVRISCCHVRRETKKLNAPNGGSIAASPQASQPSNNGNQEGHGPASYAQGRRDLITQGCPDLTTHDRSGLIARNGSTGAKSPAQAAAAAADAVAAPPPPPPPQIGPDVGATPVIAAAVRAASKNSWSPLPHMLGHTGQVPGQEDP